MRNWQRHVLRLAVTSGEAGVLPQRPLFARQSYPTRPPPIPHHTLATRPRSGQSHRLAESEGILKEAISGRRSWTYTLPVWLDPPFRTFETGLKPPVALTTHHNDGDDHRRIIAI